MRKLVSVSLLFAGCAVALAYWVFDGADSTEPNLIKREFAPRGIPQDPTSYTATENVSEAVNAQDKAGKANQSESDLALASKPSADGSEEGAVDNGRDGLSTHRSPSIDSLPAEEVLLTQDNQVSLEKVSFVLDGERYSEAIENLEAQSLDNEFAKELTNIYSGSVERAVSNFDDLYVQSFACGIRSCLGEIRSLRDGVDWDGLNQQFFGGAREGPPVYSRTTRITPDPVNPATSLYRFFISIDPDSGKVILPRSP